MENNRKLIAAIFEEQKVFITFKGDCYRYDKSETGFRCDKMNKLSQKMFWDNYRSVQVGLQERIVSWQPVASEVRRNRDEIVNEPEKSLFRENVLKRYRNRFLSDI